MGKHREEGFYERALETASPDERAERLLGGLKEQVRFAYENSPAMRAVMDGAGALPGDISSMEDLGGLPVFPKSELANAQRSGPRLGGLLAGDPGELSRVYLSPGGILDPEGRGSDYWRLAPVFFAAGARPGDIFLVTFGYHMTPGGLMCDASLRELGIAVLPTGTGNTGTQVELLKTLGATGFLGTPSFLAAVLAKAEEMGLEPAKEFNLETGLVAGEMLAPSLRERLQSDYGVMVRQFYATADVGAIAGECSQAHGMHFSEHRIVEIADPETGRPLPPGEVGEVVVTMLDNRVYPILRFGTGDLSFIEEGVCPCGRTSARLMRLVGRVDQVTKVRGMFIYPAQLSEIKDAFPEIRAVVAVVERAGDRDLLTLKIDAEPEARKSESFRARVFEKAKAVLKLRPEIETVTGLEIEEGKLILDRRTWD